MRALLQRVKHAHVEVDGRVTGRIESGLVVLLGIGRGDQPRDTDLLVDRVTGLRIFADAQGRMNINVKDAGGSLLVVSQFTLYADCTRGRRPSFEQAAKPEDAEILYDLFIQRARAQGLRVETGVFRSSMSVSLVNDGPVTLLCDTARMTAGHELLEMT